MNIIKSNSLKNLLYVENHTNSIEPKIAHKCKIKIGNLEVDGERQQTEEGFKRLFQCKCKIKVPGSDTEKVCNARFRTQELLDRHQARHTNSLQQEVILVDGSYIDGRLEECGKKIIVLGHKPPFDAPSGHEQCNHRKTLPNKCYLRHCPKCEKQRRDRYIKQFNHVILGQFNRLNFLTLTFQGHHEFNLEHKKSLEVDVKKFMDMLKYRFPGYVRIEKNSKGKDVKKSLIKYIRVLEVKGKEDGYYYHYHFLIDMPYINQAILSDIWNKATNGTSCIVDIRHIGRKQHDRNNEWSWSKRNKANARSPILYVSKYLSKPLEEITSSQYASVVYQNRFVESTSLDNKGDDRGKSEFFKCPCCGELMEYLDTIDLRGNKKDPGGVQRCLI